MEGDRQLPEGIQHIEDDNTNVHGRTEFKKYLNFGRMGYLRNLRSCKEACLKRLITNIQRINILIKTKLPSRLSF